MKRVNETKSGDCTILVMEDDYIVALDLCAHLESLGVTVIGPAAKVDDGVKLARHTSRVHGALLDVNLSGQVVYPVVDILSERNIPITFVTAYDSSMLPTRYRHFRRIEKPMDPAAVSAALSQMCPDGFSSLSTLVTD